MTEIPENGRVLLWVRTLSAPVTVEVFEELQIEDGSLSKFITRVRGHVSPIPDWIVLLVQLDYVTFIFDISTGLTLI